MKGGKPLLSIILPVYNADKYIAECVESILNQTYSDFELIIIDDGSTDDSSTIIQSFDDKRIRFVQNENNLKLIKTLNKGIECAEGGYIVRMDADDVMLPKRLEKQFDFLEKNKDYVLVGSNCIYIGEKTGFSDSSTEDDEIKYSLIFHNCVIHPSVMLRSSILKQYHLFYETDFVHIEDYALWIILREYGKFKNLSEPLIKYRIDGNNISVVNLDSHKTRHLTVYHRIHSKLFGDVDSAEMELHYSMHFGDMSKVCPKKMGVYFLKLCQAIRQTNEYNNLDGKLSKLKIKVFVKLKMVSLEQGKIFLDEIGGLSSDEKRFIIKMKIKNVLKKFLK